MKEKGRGSAFLLLGLWVILAVCALPAMAAEQEVAMAEGFSAQQTGQLEWIALLVASSWALILRVFRLRK